MKLQILGCAVMSLSLTGCFMNQKSVVVQSKQYFDESSQARIRLFGPYGDATIKRYVGKTCEDWRSTMAKKVHHRVNNGLPRRIKNISLGMPVTQRSLAASNDKGVMTRDSFKEYAVDAGQPLTLDGSISVQMNGYSHSCRVAVNFTPQAGKNYEAYYIESNRKCTIQVAEIKPTSNVQQVAETQEISDLKGCSSVGDRTT